MKSLTKLICSALLGSLILMASAYSAGKPVTKSSIKIPAKKTPPLVSNAVCMKEKAEFKTLYLHLQQSLNYEGKDTTLDSHGNIVLAPHANGKPYEGKVFEEALYKEYQNTLRKVALMYQSTKFESSPSAGASSNPELVDFIKAIDSGDGTQYIKNNNIGNVIEGLQKASIAKYPEGSPNRISDNDKYMLQKLLTHAQDRMCSIQKYKKTGNRTIYFTAEELKTYTNAPLNQLILAIKDAKITTDTDIKLENIVDQNVAMKSAITENMKALTDWAKRNKNCVALLKDANFRNNIQLGIQPCNYGKFIDSLSADNVDNLERVLHFINANEKFLNGVTPTAETGLDEMKFQGVVDRALLGFTDKIHCTLVADQADERKKLFVRNLPETNGKFDTSKISCKVKSVVLSPEDCSSKISLSSDAKGRGIEVAQKNPNGPIITFSVVGNPECEGIDLGSPDKTPTECTNQGESTTPKKIMLVSSDKKTCVEKKNNDSCKSEGVNKIPSADGLSCIDSLPILITTDLTQKICDERGNAQKPDKVILILSVDKKSCVPLTSDECIKQGDDKKQELMLSPDGKSCVAANDNTLTTESCIAQQAAQKDNKQELILSPDKKSCIPKDGLVTAEICKQKQIDSQTPNVELIPSEDNKLCVPKDVLMTPEMCKIVKANYVPSPDKKSCVPQDGLVTAEICKKKQTDSQTPNIELIPSQDNKTCVPKETLKTVEMCKIEGDAKEPKTDLIPSEDKKSCIAKTNDAEKECIDKNKKLSAENDGRPITQWIVKDGACIDSKAKPTSKKDVKDEADKDLLDIPAEKGPPARFVPIQIPQRGVYLSPGMM